MADYKGVMAYCEVSEGKLAAIGAELLGCGKKLADDLGQPLSAVIVGSGIGGLAQEAFSYGADKACIIDDALLKDYHTDSYVFVMEKLVNQVKPQVLIMGQTDTGRDLAPRLAFRLGTTVTMDCVELAIDPDSKRLLQTKPVYGGNAHAIYVTGSRVHRIATSLKREKPDPKPLLVGHDLIRANISAIRDESIDFLIDEEAKRQGYLAVESMIRSVVHKEEIEKEQLMNLLIFTRENLPSDPLDQG